MGMNDTCYFTLDVKKLDPHPHTHTRPNGQVPFAKSQVTQGGGEEGGEEDGGKSIKRTFDANPPE